MPFLNPLGSRNQKRFNPFVALVWISIGVFSLPSISRADDYEQAKVLFNIGVDAFLEENYRGALTSFETSYSINPNSTALFNIAMCYKALGEYTRSVEVFKKYRREVQNIDPDTEKKVNAAMAEMMPFTESDEREKPTEVDPESNIDTVVQQESIMSKQVLNMHTPVVKDSEMQSRSIEPVESVPFFNERENSTDGEGPSLLMIGGWTSLALGVGAGITGIYFTAAGFDHQSQGDKLWDKMAVSMNREEYNDHKKEYKYIKETALPRDNAGATIGYTLAGALFTTGIVLLLMDRSQIGEDKKRATIVPKWGGINVYY